MAHPFPPSRDPTRSIFFSLALVVVGLAGYFVMRERSDAQLLVAAVPLARAATPTAHGKTLDELVRSECLPAPCEPTWQALGHEASGLVLVGVTLQRAGESIELRFTIDPDTHEIHPANPRARALLQR